MKSIIDIIIRYYFKFKNMPNNRELKLEKTISFSGLETYSNCPKYFEEKYINKTPYEKSLESSLLIGSWTHELVEEIIKTNGDISPRDNLEDKLFTWLSSVGVTINQVDPENIINCIVELGDILSRASVHCRDPKLTIRNKDNSVLKDPINYPSSSFLSALKKAEFYKFKSQIDLEASQQVSEFLDISLTWVLADAYSIASNFKIPDWAYKTVGLELGFGVNEETAFYFNNSNVSLLGFIDWVVELDDGSTIIIDHKTSKLSSKPNPLEVLYHPQLNLYAYVYEQVTGKKVNYIGINHLRSGDIIIAEVDNIVRINNYEHIVEIFTESQQGPYIRRRPTDYMSPCIKKDFKSGKILSTCSYLNKCWPSYHESLEKGLHNKTND